MPIFELQNSGGKSFEVDAPDIQAAMSAIGGGSKGGGQPPPDKYQAAAIQDVADQKSYRDRVASYPGATMLNATMRRIVQGATLNTADEILAGLSTPVEMIKRGILDPREGYNYAKAAQNLALEQARKDSGALGTAAEIGGGVASGSTAARSGLSLLSRLAPNAGIGARSAASAADAAGYGTVAGLAEGDTAGERAKNAAMGGLFGGVVGTAAPTAARVVGGILSPVVSHLQAWRNPAQYGATQVARGIQDASISPAQAAQSVQQAAAEGQGAFTLADALGIPGQRMLSSVARAPGPGRTAATEFLEQRQAGQGRRVANQLAEGFDAPQTAAATRAQQVAARDAAADTAYEAGRQGAGPVDVTRIVGRIDQTVRPGVNQLANPESRIAPDSIEAALDNVRRRLTDGRSNLTDFTSLQRVRGDLSDAIQAAVQSGAGNKARLMGQVLREMDNAMEAASPGFRAANADFRARSLIANPEGADIIAQGRTAALRGRTEDTIPAFQAMTPGQQQGFRVGYVDPLIEQSQGAAIGANKARPLTSDAFVDEAAAMAPGNARMTRQIGRENTMFETRRQATGGSQTADNLADADAVRSTPSMIARLVPSVLTGGLSGLRHIISAGSNVLSGNTPAVREEMARLLMMRGGNTTPQQLQGILDEAINRIRMQQLLMSQLGTGASSGLATVPGATGMRRQ